MFPADKTTAATAANDANSDEDGDHQPVVHGLKLNQHSVDVILAYHAHHSSVAVQHFSLPLTSQHIRSSSHLIHIYIHSDLVTLY